jgi:hypothetical protein
MDYSDKFVFRFTAVKRAAKLSIFLEWEIITL